jgi:hypothetical protein
MQQTKVNLRLIDKFKQQSATVKWVKNFLCELYIFPTFSH